MSDKLSNLPKKALHEAGWHTAWWAIRGEKILEWLWEDVCKPWRKTVGTAMLSLIPSICAWWKGVPLPVLVIIALGVAAIVLFAWDLAARRITLSASKRTAALLVTTPSSMPVLAELTGNKSISPAPPQPVKIGEIRYDFNPSTPEIPPNGWDWESKGKQTRVEFRNATNAPCAGCITVIPNGLYQLRTALVQSTQVCDHLEFSSYFVNNEAAVCLWVEVMLRDGTGAQEEKITYNAKGRLAPSKDSNGKWVVTMTGDALSNNWRRFSVYLREDVAKTIDSGGNGLVFNRLVGISLRGHISISPIELYESR